MQSNRLLLAQLGLAAATLTVAAMEAFGQAAVAQTAAVAETSLLHFDAETPVVLGTQPTVINLFSDSQRELVVLGATAELDAPPAESGPATDVPLEFDFGAGFGPLPDNARLPPAGRVRVRLRAPSGAKAGMTGWLTVRADSETGLAVARRALETAQDPVPASAVDSWSVTSTVRSPRQHDGGTIGAAIPLTSGSECSATQSPSSTLVDRDRVVSVTTTCTSDNKLQLVADSFPAPGTYKGKIKVGDSEVALEVRRTLSMIWPSLLILLGFLLALWSQGRLDQGWRLQQRWWLYRLPKRAKSADDAYVIAAEDAPWENYDLANIVTVDAAAAKRELERIRRSRPFMIRRLPWPDGYMQAERDAVRKQILTMDKLVRDWPGMPAVFAAANVRIGKEPYYVVRAPKLIERALVIITAAGDPVTTSELSARCAEASSLPAALDVVEDVEALDAYLRRFERKRQDLPLRDRDTLIRAREYERQASAVLRETTDATRVQGDVGQLVERATRLGSRLPPPGPPEAVEDEHEVGEIRKETVGAEFGEILRLPIRGFQRVGAFLRASDLAVGHTTLILLTLAIGLWSGLVALYNDKAWGVSYADYIAAFVWGFGAATVIAPVISAAKQLGARPQDSAVPTGAK